MKSYRKELYFCTNKRREYINITRDVEEAVYESGIKEVAEVEFDQEIDEPMIDNKNPLYAYPVRITYIDGLNKIHKVIYTLEKDLGFKKGDKLKVVTYRRVIVKAELRHD